MCENTCFVPGQSSSFSLTPSWVRIAGISGTAQHLEQPQHSSDLFWLELSKRKRSWRDPAPFLWRQDQLAPGPSAPVKVLEYLGEREGIREHGALCPHSCSHTAGNLQALASWRLTFLSGNQDFCTWRSSTLSTLESSLNEMGYFEFH